ncbi:GH25 family lysozyme [uncultured Kordia sp.]|uniref:glycoside hydrolase family 25 protein n=1 Tax=uncultured Kordia sp. TaxID=507699 RepID=UPI00261B562E|nr:GH25 family lysozyme [uncultured Kordia sp.]
MNLSSIQTVLQGVYQKDKSLLFTDFLKAYFKQNRKMLFGLFHVELNQAILYCAVDDIHQPCVTENVLQEFMTKILEMKADKEIEISAMHKEQSEDIIIFSNLLEIEAIEEQRIVFSNGYYTNNPTVIKNASGKVAYKGTFLNETLCEQLKQLINQKIEPTVKVLKSGEKKAIAIPETAVTKRQTVLKNEEEKIEEVIEKKTSHVAWFQKKHKLLVILSSITFLLIIGLITLLYMYFTKHPKEEAQTKLQHEIVQTTQPVASNFPTTTSKNYNIKNIQYGLDISHYNGNIVSLLNSKDSIHFVICKATQGDYFVDPTFKNNWKELKEKKIIRGAYHFYDAEVSPIQQAKHFLQVVGNFDTNDIAPVLDIEELSFNGEDITKATLQHDLLLFLQYITAKTERNPIIYVDTSFANHYLDNKEFAKYKLYLASWTHENFPKLPIIWEEEGLFLWQKSDSYHFENTTDDLDVFFGNLKDIYKE